MQHTDARKHEHNPPHGLVTGVYKQAVFLSYNKTINLTSTSRQPVVIIINHRDNSKICILYKIFEDMI